MTETTLEQLIEIKKIVAIESVRTELFDEQTLFMCLEALKYAQGAIVLQDDGWDGNRGNMYLVADNKRYEINVTSDPWMYIRKARILAIVIPEIERMYQEGFVKRLLNVVTEEAEKKMQRISLEEGVEINNRHVAYNERDKFFTVSAYQQGFKYYPTPMKNGYKIWVHANISDGHTTRALEIMRESLDCLGIKNEVVDCHHDGWYWYANLAEDKSNNAT